MNIQDDVDAIIKARGAGAFVILITTSEWQEFINLAGAAYTGTSQKGVYRDVFVAPRDLADNVSAIEY